MPISNIQKNRKKKLEAVRKAEFNPYPTKTKRTHSILQALIDFDNFSKERLKITLAGRIKTIREHGGSTFFNFEDGTGEIQAYFKEDALGKEKYRFFLDNFDIGDFIEVSGIIFKTKKGEKTIEAKEYRMLAKSLLPLPEKWHGLQDIEERFRKRHLDLIINKESREKFKMRSKIIEELRNILNSKDFLEVETPILQSIPGGALAKPFKTHLNALKLDLYLRVSPELYLKRLLVGGFEKIYEIGRCFRNEGMDAYHNPDFTMIELYWAYQDRDGLMVFVEEVFQEILRRIKKSSKFIYQGKEIDFKVPFERISFKDLVKKYTGIDSEKAAATDILKKLKEMKVEFGKETPRCKLLDELYKTCCRGKIINPTFIVDYPVEMAILAKTKEDNPKEVHRFQLVVAGIELINGFSELNDPLEQERRFKDSKIEFERKDKDFLEALQYGMPPSAGLGMGVDRLVALLTDSHSLREAILFPIMRPLK
ncbi:MAG: lysine--tRNA ligase [Candidatus Nealsonbacteria bacterium]